MRTDRLFASASALAGLSGLTIDPWLGLAVSLVPGLLHFTLHKNPRDYIDPLRDFGADEFTVVNSYYWATDRPDSDVLGRFVRRFPQHEEALRQFHEDWQRECGI